MSINWKVRLRNPSFWVSVAIAIFVPILTYMGLTAKDITTWKALGNVLIEAVRNPYVLIMVAASVYNAMIDPTSTGISDSSRAMDYEFPNSIKK